MKLENFFMSVPGLMVPMKSSYAFYTPAITLHNCYSKPRSVVIQVFDILIVAMFLLFLITIATRSMRFSSHAVELRDKHDASACGLGLRLALQSGFLKFKVSLVG